MADHQSLRDEASPSRGELDQLNFDHHREERHRLMETSRPNHDRRPSDDRASRTDDREWRDDGGSRSFSSWSQEFGREEHGGGHGEARWGARDWTTAEPWRVPGPFAGRGPRGYQRADDHIRAELNDRLTAHGLIDATDIECDVHESDVTLSGFVDSPETKCAAEYVAEGIQGVHDVHNSLRIRSRQDADRVGAPNAARPLESTSRTPSRSGDTDTRGSRSRTK